MRKPLLLPLFAVLAVFMAAADSAHAQLSFGAAAGPSFPMGDLGDEAETGFHVQGTVGFSVPLLPVGLRADLMWQRFPDEVSGNFRQIGGIANAIIRLPLPLVRPYLLAGAGLIDHDSPDAQHGDHVHEGESGTSSAFAAGVGLELRLILLRAGLEARYLTGGEGRGSVPISVVISF